MDRPAHKDEARRALTTVREALEGAKPIDGLWRRQLAATLAYAEEELAQVQELKRPRRAAGAAEAPAAS